MKDQLLKEIMLEMVEIYHLGKGHFRHNKKHIVGALINSSEKKYGLEWDKEIIRDEVYFTTWKAILKFGSDYTESELEIILNQLRDTTDSPKIELRMFLASIKSYVEIDLKTYLLPESRKAADRSMLDIITEATDFEGLEYLFSFSIFDDTQQSHFMKWCIENWGRVLTAKQKEFMNGLDVPLDKDMTPTERRNYGRRQNDMKNRISKRLLDKYELEHGKDRKRAEIQAKVDKINEILDAKDFVSCLLYNHNTDFIIDAIYDGVSKPQIVKFNRATHNGVPVPEETQGCYRYALFQALLKFHAELDK